MGVLTTKDIANTPMARLVYSGRARIGYLCQSRPTNPESDWIWELSLISEKRRGFLRGRSPSEAGARAALEENFVAWCAAAGLRRVDCITSTSTEEAASSATARPAKKTSSTSRRTRRRVAE